MSKAAPLAIRTSPSIRPPVGLLVSIGAPKPERGPGRPIDWFRFKDGQRGEHAEAAAKARDIYGEQPKQLTDLYFLSNDITDVLDIRYVAFGKSGLRGIGSTNFALLPEDEFLEQAWRFEDDFTFFPRELSEVPTAQRDTWKGEGVTRKLEGPDDKGVRKLDIRLSASLYFLLPRVMGIGRVARLSTGGRRSTKNLYKSVRTQHEFFRGQLIGPAFRLELRPARTQRFDPEKRAYLPVDFFELVLDTALDVQAIYEAMKQRDEALGPGEADARMLGEALALPAPSEESQIREEPAAFERPDDATLNRIARLIEEAGDGALTYLQGVFGVDSPEQLSAEDAARYELGLGAFLGESDPPLEGEVMDE